MAEVLAKVSSVPAPWSISTDPGGLLTITPTAPLTVQYSTGGSDTVPAGVAAAECPLDAAFVWCPYITVGDATLHVAKESDVGAIAGDFCVLAHVYQHHVAPHQPGSVAVPGAAAISFIVNGGARPIATGVAGALVVPFPCTITSAVLLADVSASCVLDVQKDDYAGYPSSTSLVSSSPPTLAATIKSQDTLLTGWTTALSAGDILRYLVTSNDLATEVTIVLLVSRL